MPVDHARKSQIREVMAADGVSYREAAAIVDDPRNQIMCDTCGWTWGMVCPECPGCGCYNGRCTGWRHAEDSEPDYDDPNYGVYCLECGAGSSGPYDECTCYEEDEDREGAPG